MAVLFERVLLNAVDRLQVG